jgi:cellulose synthase/poly-beta-1,6-N-acetylglucosamine synthase-like glycosyltransferase
MFIGPVALYEWIMYGRVHFFLFFWLYVWGRFLPVWYMSLHYVPRTFPGTPQRFREVVKEKVSVVLPVANKKSGEGIGFAQVLRSYINAGIVPKRIVVVLNGQMTDGMKEVREICKGLKVTWLYQKEGDKPNAIVVGIQYVKKHFPQTDFLGNSDDDTIFPNEKSIHELIVAMLDSIVGGVCGWQRIYQPDTLPQKGAAFVEDLRAMYAFPAASFVGQVTCLPGRFYMVRFALISNGAFYKAFLNRRGFGQSVRVSDDRFITMWIQLQGYWTVFQLPSLLYTEALPTWLQNWRQAGRWNGGSQLSTMTVEGGKVCRRRVWVGYVYYTDINTPHFLLGVIASATYNVLFGIHWFITLQNMPVWQQVLFGLLGMVASMTMRHMRYYARVFVGRGWKRQWRWLLVPFVALYNVGFLTFFHTFNRVLHFVFSATHMGWATRKVAADQRTWKHTANAWLKRAAWVYLLVMGVTLYANWFRLPIAEYVWLLLGFAPLTFLMIALIVWTIPRRKVVGYKPGTNAPGRKPWQHMRPAVTWWGQVTIFTPIVISICLVVIYASAGQLVPLLSAFPPESLFASISSGGVMAAGAIAMWMRRLSYQTAALSRKNRHRWD